MKRHDQMQYDQIPIPDSLDAVIDRAAARAARRRRPLRAGLCAASVFLALFATANTPLYAHAIDLPVLGRVVQVLHIGEGGTPTDGLTASAEAQAQKVDLTFTGRTGEALTEAPAYTVSHFRAPDRIVLNIGGVRMTDRDAILSALEATDGVSAAYFGMILDDSAIQLIVELNPGWTYAVSELAEPGGLSLTFSPADAPADETPVYYLRSEAQPYGEALGLLAERFYNLDATQVRTEEGNFIVTVGEYASEAEAQAALDALTAAHGDLGLTIAQALPSERPHDAP